MHQTGGSDQSDRPVTSIELDQYGLHDVPEAEVRSAGLRVLSR